MSDDKRINAILIVPGSSQVKQFSFHKNLVYIAGGSVLTLLLGCGIGVVNIITASTGFARQAALQAENNKLKQENEIYQNSYSKLKGQVAYVNDMSKELAKQAKLEPGSDIDSQLGTGGPETVTALDKASSQLETRLRNISDTMHAEQLKLSTVPSGYPVSGYITDDFGTRRNPMGEGHEFHPGLDIVAEYGTPISATADGIIIHAGPQGGYGNLVAIYHSNGIVTRYGHMSKVSVEVGQKVKRGDTIGNLGSTGRSTGPHCHYEVRENDQSVNPMNYIAQPKS
jgi:murein DD-endopeptidase MepM/ murein hydrolase activator NlpD